MKRKSYNYSMMAPFLLFMLIPVVVFASPAEEPEETHIPILDTAQELFGSRANTVANRLDLFFADQRADDELARSRIRLRQRYTVKEREELVNDHEIRFNIRLPKLEQRFKFELDKKETDKQDSKSGTTSDIARKILNKNWQFRADLGVNASIPPKVFSRARVRRNMTSGDVIHRFVQEVAWFSDRDWEEYTTFDSDLDLGDDTLLRFRNQADWLITRKDFSTRHGPRVLHRLSVNDAIQYGVSMSTIVDDGVWFVNNYNISTTYRRNLYKQWFYMDLTPGLEFPKKWSFRRTPYFTVQFEALFGGY